VGTLPPGAREPRDDVSDDSAGRLDAKKKSLGASEQDPRARQEWQDALASLAHEQIVSVDETSTHLALSRRYARSPMGERAFGFVPRNHGPNTTLVTALTKEGLGPAMTVQGAMDTAAFLVYVRDFLVPTLRPGQIVLLDNLAAHKHEAVRQLIADAGCQLLFLPPYSPDFAPIELAFSKLKEALRKAAARTQEALDQAIATALDLISTHDARAFFRHCGYRLQAEAP
jgi:transposase